MARRTFGLCLAKDWGLWPQATLKTFSQNDKQLAGTPGAVAVLHTHNRRLGFHPHVHVCMPAAALHTALDTGRRLWRTKVRLGKAPGSRAPARGGYLFNHKALATVFAAKLKAALGEAGLLLPSELPADLLADLPAQWVVDCKAVGDGQAALRYLGRYLYRGVIRKEDIVACQDGQVRYRWRDAKTGKSATRSVPGADFLWLLLQHVLPRGLQRARTFGFLHHNSRRTLRLLQLTQGLPAPLPPSPPPPTRPLWRCACGQPMRILRRRMGPQEAAAATAATQAPRTVRPDKPEPAQAVPH